MRRDFVYWAFALAVGVALSVAFIENAIAYTPEQLLSERDVRFDCDEKTKVCKVSQADLEWMVQRDALLTKLVEVAARQMRNCGVKGV